MSEISSNSLKMITTGFVLSVVNDLSPKGKFQFLQNIRVFTEGVLESRPTLEDFAIVNFAQGLVPHSLKTIIDKSNSTKLRALGIGTKLFTGAAGILSSKDTGYSGNPYFLIDFRPEQSIQAYLYIADENKFKKLSVSDSLTDVGINTPKFAATWALGKPNRKIIDKIDSSSTTDWDNLTGSAGAPTGFTRVDEIIDEVLYDDADPGFASIIIEDMPTALQADSIVTIGGGAADDVVVEDVLPAAFVADTIASIIYEDTMASTGKCLIVLTTSSTTITRNSTIFVDDGSNTEYIRVTDIIYDGNGVPTIETSTINTYATTTTLAGVASFRAYLPNTHTAGNRVTNDAIKSVIGASGISSLTRTFAFDLTNADGKPLSLDDILHISLLVSDPSKINEVQIQVDVDSATNDFTKNYFYYVVNPNLLTGAVQQTSPTISVIQQALQQGELLNQHILRAREIDPFGRDGLLIENPAGNEGILTESAPIAPNIQQTTTGADQWSEIKFRLSELAANRVGSDAARTLKDIQAIRISVNAKAAVDIYIDSIWVGGADALDSSDKGFLPYNYVWRIRDPDTKVSSNWSPPLRTGIKVSRGKVILSFPNANTDYPITYNIDIARFGGNLNDFRLVGTLKNDGSTYTDTSSDRIIADNGLAGRFEGQGATDAVFDFYKPFAVIDTPKKGVCDVNGTKFLWISGDKLNESYPRGVQIVINGKVNKFYANPIDDENVELERNMDKLSNVVFEIEEPLLTGQPLPVIFGPFGEGSSGLFIYGLGYKNAAGTLYWCDGNSPDTMSDINYLEITSPSEPLITGVMWDGYGQVFSNSRSFTILPTQAADGTIGFMARENAGSRGVYSRWTIDVGTSHIYFLSETADGIYRVQGNGIPECVTSGGFNNLFYINGKTPTPITLIDGTIIYPPDFSLLPDLRLFCINDFVIFRFKDTDPAGAKQVALIFDTKINEFISYDIYPSNKINMFYREEIDGEVNILVCTTDAIKKFGSGTEASITSKVIPFSFDAGNSRIIKEFKEIVVDTNAEAGQLALTNLYDNGTEQEVLAPLIGNAERTQYIISLQDANGIGKNKKNLTTAFSWDINIGLKLYEELFYYQPKPDIVTDRSSDIIYGDGIGDKLWQGIIIEADTFGADKVLNFYDDENVLRATLTINHSGRETREYSFDQPFISHTIRRASNDDVSWQFFTEAYISDPEPESAKVWEGEINLNNFVGLILLQRMGIAYRSTEDATIKIFDESGTEQTYDLPNSNSTWHKEFFYMTANKWLGCKYRIETEGVIRVYKKHSEIWAKQFTSQEGFVPTQPFGGESNINNVLI